MSIRHSHIQYSGQYDRSDIYIICRMHCLSSSSAIRICDNEIFDAQWTPLRDFAHSTDTYPLNTSVARLVEGAVLAAEASGQDLTTCTLACDIAERDVQASPIKPLADATSSPPKRKSYKTYFIPQGEDPDRT